MRTNYYDGSREKFYRYVDRKIMVEEFLEEPSGAPAIDYRFFVYDGVPKFFYVSFTPDVGPEEAKAFAENQALARALLAKWPELKDGFSAIEARATEASGRDFGTVVELKDLK